MSREIYARRQKNEPWKIRFGRDAYSHVPICKKNISLSGWRGGVGP